MPVVEVRGLTKSYGGRPPALRDVTLAIPEGVTGLLGPNGAGKSTLLQCVLGLLRGFSGEVTVLGVDARRHPREVRRRVGFMPETDAWLPQRTGVRAVACLGRLGGLPRAEALRRAHDVLHHVGLGEAVYRDVEEYSTGMRQRFKLAQALVHDPALLFLDEPTSGMDPQGRDDMLALIADLARHHGKHVVWSSHVLPEIQRSVQQVVVLQRGTCLGLHRLEDLAARPGLLRVEVEAAEGDPAAAQGPVEALVAALRAQGLRVEGAPSPTVAGRWAFEAEAPPQEAAAAPARVLAAAARVGARVRRLTPLAEDLETLFLRLVGGRGGAA